MNFTVTFADGTTSHTYTDPAKYRIDTGVLVIDEPVSNSDRIRRISYSHNHWHKVEEDVPNPPLVPVHRLESLAPPL